METAGNASSPVLNVDDDFQGSLEYNLVMRRNSTSDLIGWLDGEINTIETEHSDRTLTNMGLMRERIAAGDRVPDAWSLFSSSAPTSGNKRSVTVTPVIMVGGIECDYDFHPIFYKRFLFEHELFSTKKDEPRSNSKPVRKYNVTRPSNPDDKTWKVVAYWHNEDGGECKALIATVHENDDEPGEAEINAKLIEQALNAYNR